MQTLSKFPSVLLERLNRSVDQFKARYQGQRDQMLYVKFDPLLFSVNFEPLHFYFGELDHTLAQLAQLGAQDKAQFAFFTEKLIAQCNALTDALDTPKVQNQNAGKITAELSARERRRQEIDRLPPRERLEKYYDALQALNDKLNRQQDQLRQNADSGQQSHYGALIEQTRRRRRYCLDAIEVLEEYLAFKDAQE